MPDPDSIPLEPQASAHADQSSADPRPRLPEPLPVWLISVDDVHLPAPADLDAKLDDFYVGLLQFQRLPDELAYRAENFVLRFDVYRKPIPHESVRPQGIEILFPLADLEKTLIEREVEYTRQRGITPGSESLLLIDPAGNWVEITQRREIR